VGRRIALTIIFLIALLFAAAWVESAECMWCTPTYCAFDHDCDEQAGCACCIPQGEIDGRCC
jgi:hypothetical protein